MFGHLLDQALIDDVGHWKEAFSLLCRVSERNSDGNLTSVLRQDRRNVRSFHSSTNFRKAGNAKTKNCKTSIRH